VGLLREAVSFAVRWSGVSFLVRALIARKKVGILVYHDPPPFLMKRHLEYLSKRYTFLPLGRLVDAVQGRDWSGIPPRSLVVTLDDAHRGNIELLPLFTRYGVRPTIFCCTQIVGTNRHFWFFAARDPESLKRLPNNERLSYLEEASGFSPVREYSPDERQALTYEEIAQMKDHVDFESHTRFHPILPTCSLEECDTEISRSKAELQLITGQLCRHFSYPNGDYSEREIELVQLAGYSSARTMDLGWNDVNTDPFRLKVIPVRDDASVNRLTADLSGVAGYLGRFRRHLRWPHAPLG
jgi:peptidoglycan/xylan/chitin deacetylase (PgdA/CDA1 family)